MGINNLALSLNNVLKVPFLKPNFNSVKAALVKPLNSLTKQTIGKIVTIYNFPWQGDFFFF